MLRDSYNIRAKLEHALDEAKLERSLWERVEILKKKDGSDFARKTQSFKNATWYDNGKYSLGGYYPEIAVTGCGKIGGWKTFTLYMYEYVEDMRADDPRREKANPKQDYLRQTYTLSVDEASNKMKARVLQLSKRIEALEKQLDSLERIYNNFFDEVEDLMQNLKNACFDFREDDNYPSSVEYAVVEELQKCCAGSLLR